MDVCESSVWMRDREKRMFQMNSIALFEEAGLDNLIIIIIILIFHFRHI